MGEAKRRGQAQAEFEATDPSQRLGDQPIEAKYYDDMRALAQALDMTFNGQVGGPGRKVGFVLMVFPFDEVAPGGKGRCNYISNGADRKDIAVLMREMIARFEGMPEMTGKA